MWGLLQSCSNLFHIQSSTFHNELISCPLKQWEFLGGTLEMGRREQCLMVRNWYRFFTHYSVCNHHYFVSRLHQFVPLLSRILISESLKRLTSRILSLGAWKRTKNLHWQSNTPWLHEMLHMWWHKLRTNPRESPKCDSTIFYKWLVELLVSSIKM